MTSSISEERLIVAPVKVRVTDSTLTVHLKDGRSISVPTKWYPRLVHGTRAERANYEVDWYGIHWPDLDEDISVKGLLLGSKSGESSKSINRWLAYRARGEKVPVPTLPMPSMKLDARKRNGHRATHRRAG